jgi:tetratricopeptide (TPR) repeat protein
VLLLKLAPRIQGHEADAAELCGRLPLKLDIFGKVVAERTVFTVPQLLEMLRARQHGFAPEDAAFQLSYDTLPKDQQRAWALLAVFPGTWDLEAAAEIWEVSAHSAAELMQALVSANLVEQNQADGRFRLHDLVRAFCHERLSDAEREAAMMRYARHYAKVAWAADRLYQQGGGAVIRGLTLFDRERIHIEAAYEWLAPKRDEASASLLGSLVERVVYIQDMRFHPRQRIRWLESQRKAAVITKNRQQEGNAFGNLGVAYQDLGEPRKAIEFYEQRLVIAREIRDRRGEGAALGNLGNAYADLGEPRKAIEFYEQQLVIAREIGDRRGEGAALGNLGIAYADLGERRKAIEFYEQALVIAREIGDRRGEGNALGNLGIAYADLGEPRKAIEFYEQALAILREIGDRRSEGIHLYNSALALDELGDRVQAVARAELALKLFEAVEHPGMSQVRAALEVWKRKGQPIDNG